MNIFRYINILFGVFCLALFVFLGIGLTSSSFTNINVNLKVTYDSNREEILKVRLDSTQGQVTYIGIDDEKNLFDVRQLNGWFLRWGNFYIFPSWVMTSPYKPRFFEIKPFYIKEVSNGKFILINHQRGTYISTKKGTTQVKGMFTSHLKNIDEL